MAHKHKSNDCVSLDLFVGDEDDEPNTSQSNVVETLCLRILSKSNIKYKFGGLQIHIRSPDFHVGKSFHVNLDENNRIDSIESYREPEESFQFCRRRVSLLNSNNIYNTQPARILITPKKQPETELKNLPDLTNNLINTDTQLPNNNNVTSASILNNLTSNNQATNLINKTNQNNNNNNSIKKLPILTADVVVEEILDNKAIEKTQEPNQSIGQSLGQSLVNTFLNKKVNSNQSSVNNSPSQSINSINSLSSSLLELRTTVSPTNLTSSPEKLISKLTLQSFGHSENKYIKHKSKKYDFKKKSKEKLLKNGDKNENGNKKSQSIVEKEKIIINNDQKKTEENKEESKHNKNINNNLKQTETKQTVQTKEIGVGTNSIGKLDIFGSNFYSNFEASNLSLSSLTLPQGFFFNLRRTRSWKK